MNVEAAARAGVPARQLAVRLAVAALMVAVGLAGAYRSIGPKVMAGDEVTMRSITGDTTAGIAAFRYYVDDGWHLPLLHTRQLDAPRGTVIAFTDSIPVLALAAKLLRPLHIPVERWWGWWLTAGFVAQALAACFAVRSWLPQVGSRVGSWLIPVAAAPLFVMFPPFLLRQFHPSLAFHAPLLVSVGLIGRARRGGPSGPLLVAAGAVTVVALLIHPYHLVACLVVLAAGLADLTRRHVLAPRRFLWWLGGTLAVLVGVALVMGYTSQPTVPASGYGYYALIPYSMVVPQLSTLTPWTNGLLVAGDDFEGFAWLGVGGVLLVAAGAVLLAARGRRLAVRWQSLLLGLALLFAYAVTPRVHLNPTDPLDLPAFLTRVTGSPRRALALAGAVSLAAGLAWLAGLWRWRTRLWPVPARSRVTGSVSAGAAYGAVETPIRGEVEPAGAGAGAVGPARRGWDRLGGLPPWTSALTQAGVVSAGFGVVALAAPGLLARLTGTFRGSGRMVWSVLYVALVASVALLARHARWPVALGVVALASGLQLADTGRYRAFDAFLYQPDLRHVAQMSALADLMRADGAVSLTPGYYCTAYPDGVTQFIDVIGAAALAGVPIDNSYTARQVTVDCPQGPVMPPVAPGRTAIAAVPTLFDTDATPPGECRGWQTEIIVCSLRWGELSPEASAWFTIPGPRAQPG